MKPVTQSADLSGPAADMLVGLARAYRLPPALLVRVIVESVLDAASEDGDMQRDLAEATRFLRKTGHVPECWLDLEGARYEDGPDDSGAGPYSGNEKAAEKECRQSHAKYGDDAANWGERSDNWEHDWFIRERTARRKRQRLRFESLADAG